MRVLALLLYVWIGLALVARTQGSIHLRDLWSSTLAIGKGLAADAPNLLPTVREVLNAGKQVLAGYPYVFASTWINFICSRMMAVRAVRPKVMPDIEAMHFQLLTPCGRHSVPLLQADLIALNPAFDLSKPVVVLATGWLTTVNDTGTIDAFAHAFACRGDVNFIAVDAAKFVDTLYTWSALNTQEIGFHMARGLALLAAHVPVEHMHLIGHSLGAHIVGAAGRYFQEITGRRLPRITGLDPAKPCFNEGEKLSGLQRGDADFIDVVHSNPGVLGKRQPLGDVDFYPGGLQPLPAGCFRITCAHARAWQYFAESVYPGMEHNFLATKCSSLKSLRDNKCVGPRVPMGLATPHHLRGSYFLDVRGRSPYGMNAPPPDARAQCRRFRCVQLA